MFARWKKRTTVQRRKRWAPPSRTTWYAVLVQSQRIHGTPRQKIVRLLASIQEENLQHPAHRRQFWQHVDRHLAELDLDATTRQHIAEKLCLTVPRPTAAELEQGERQWRSVIRWLVTAA
jgi:hypothetical protein